MTTELFTGTRSVPRRSMKPEIPILDGWRRTHKLGVTGDLIFILPWSTGTLGFDYPSPTGILKFYRNSTFKTLSQSGWSPEVRKQVTTYLFKIVNSKKSCFLRDTVGGWVPIRQTRHRGEET